MHTLYCVDSTTTLADLYLLSYKTEIWTSINLMYDNNTNQQVTYDHHCSVVRIHNHIYFYISSLYDVLEEMFLNCEDRNMSTPCSDEFPNTDEFYAGRLLFQYIYKMERCSKYCYFHFVFMTLASMFTRL